MIKDISLPIRHRIVPAAAAVIMLFLLLPVSVAQASTTVSGTIPDGTVWDVTSSPYLVEADVVVPSGATLSVEAGATVHFAVDAALSVEGSLNVNGAYGNEAVFMLAPGATGHWGGIVYESGSLGGSISYADVSGAGVPCDPVIGCRGGISIIDGTVNISDSRVHDSLEYGVIQYAGTVNMTGTHIYNQSYGFSLAYGTATLDNNRIYGNSQYGVNANAWLGTLTLTNNIFTDNLHASARVNGGVDLTASGNTSSGSTRNGLLMYGELSFSQTWNASLPYIIEDADNPAGGMFTVPLGKTLSIGPGTTVKGEGGGRLSVYGSFVVDGTDTGTVAFTSLMDDAVSGDTNGDAGATVPVKGDWDGIEIMSGGSASLVHAQVRYAGVPCAEGCCGGLTNRGGTVTVSDSRIHDSLVYGLLQYAGTMTVAGSEIFDNSYGISIAGGDATVTGSVVNDNLYHGFTFNSPTSGSLTIHGSSIADNGTYGVYVASAVTVDATNNWWGDASGPYHSSNTGGLGNVVTDNVLFEPKLGQWPPMPEMSISDLAQHYDSQPIPEGDEIRGADVALSAYVTAPTGGQVRLEVELKPFSTPFDGMDTVLSDPTDTGTAQVEAKAYEDVPYHWRARTVSAADPSVTTDWLEFGTDPAAADFVQFTKTFKVAVILADLADEEWVPESELLRPCKVISVDRNYTFDAGETADEFGYALYSDDLFSCINDYYRENSYGLVQFDHDIVGTFTSDLWQVFHESDGVTQATQEYYVSRYNSSGEQTSDGLVEYIESALSIAQGGDFDVVMAVHDGIRSQEPASKELKEKRLGDSAGKYSYSDGSFDGVVTISSRSSFGVWAHELGHVLGLFMNGTGEAAHDLYVGSKSMPGADIGAWGLMGTGSDVRDEDLSSPPHMSTYTKAHLGLLTDDYSVEFPQETTMSVPMLASQGAREKVFKYWISSPLNVGSAYYILEGRSRIGTHQWDNVLPGEADTHLVLYYVDPLIDVVEIPGVNGDTINDGILHPGITETYHDLNSLIDFTADNVHVNSDSGIKYVDARIEATDIGSEIIGAVFRLSQDSNFRSSLVDFWDNLPLFADGEDGPGLSVVAEETGGMLGTVSWYGLSIGILISLILLLIIVLAIKVVGVEVSIWKLLIIGILAIILVHAFGYRSLVGNRTIRAKVNPGYNHAWPYDIYLAPDTGVIDDFGLDLHVFCDDGRHVGMNYETGEYEVQIEDVITNGDNQGAPEWIFFPPEGNESCRHVVSAHDNAEFLVAHPDIAAQLEDMTDSYDIYARYIDPASGIYTSTTLEAQAIEPDEAVVHAVSGTTDVVIAAGVVDTTAPVTTAQVTGTLAPDGVTYVTPVTVTLSADDGTDGTGVASLVYSTDGGLNWDEYDYAMPISFTEEGTHILHFGATDNAWNEEVTQALDITIDLLSADLSVLFRRHTVGQGNEPGSSKEPVVGAVVNAYSKTLGSCADIIGYNPHDYSTVLSTCTPDGTGTTGSDGLALLTLDPGEYILVSEDPQTQVVAGVHSGSLADGDTADKRLNVIVRADGTSVPAKTSKHDGSVLYVIEPEYIEWDDTTELYPFVFDSEGDWGVTVTVEPPEGFVSDYDQLSTDVNTDYKALQFTLTDVGSCWECGTGIDIEITHNGRKEHLHRNIPTPMTEEFVKAKGLDVAEVRARGVRVNGRKSVSAPLSLSDDRVTLKTWTSLYRLFVPVG
jgi:M6 family metalloprotease-like protein